MHSIRGSWKSSGHYTWDSSLVLGISCKKEGGGFYKNGRQSGEQEKKVREETADCLKEITDLNAHFLFSLLLLST